MGFNMVTVPSGTTVEEIRRFVRASVHAGELPHVEVPAAALPDDVEPDSSDWLIFDVTYDGGCLRMVFERDWDSYFASPAGEARLETERAKRRNLAR